MRGHTAPIHSQREDTFTVDIYTFGPIAAVLDAAYGIVAGLQHALDPIAGGASAALAIVIITLALRLLLIPVGASQVRAEFTRRRLAPRLQELQKKYKKNPELLQKKMLELYTSEKASPIAGVLPALAQAPVLFVVYGLFVLHTINGHANALLQGHVLGASLASSLMSGTVAWPGLIVFAVLLATIAVVAWLQRRTAQKIAAMDVASATDPTAKALSRWLSWLPFITVVFAAVVPLAATIYLAVTTTWTLVERTIIRRALSAR